MTMITTIIIVELFHGLQINFFVALYIVTLYSYISILQKVLMKLTTITNLSFTEFEVGRKKRI